MSLKRKVRTLYFFQKKYSEVVPHGRRGEKKTNMSGRATSKGKKSPIPWRLYGVIFAGFVACLAFRQWLDGGAFLEKRPSLVGKVRAASRLRAPALCHLFSLVLSLMCFPLPQVAIITGGTDGIGVETVREFFNLGAHVVLPVRSRDKAEALVAELMADSPLNAEVTH